MLNEEYTAKAEMLLRIVKDSKETGKGFPPVTAYDVEWLVDTIDFMVKRYEAHVACCLPRCMRQPN